MKKVKLLIFLIFPILLIVFLVKQFAFNKSLAAWFDDRWGYRTAINITNSGAAGKIPAYAAPPAKPLATHGKASAGRQINCNDSRFTDTI